MPAPAEVNPRAGTERSLPLPSAPAPLGQLGFLIQSEGFFYFVLLGREKTMTDTFSISILTNFQSPASTLEGAAMVATKITSAGHTRIIPSRKEREGEGGIGTKW